LFVAGGLGTAICLFLGVVIGRSIRRSPPGKVT